MAAVRKIDQSEFREQVLESGVPVLVDFYADWCPPCRMQAPVLDDVAQHNSGAKIVKVNVDENQQLAARYGISAIPTLLVFKAGQVARTHQGLAGKDQIESWLAG